MNPWIPYEVHASPHDLPGYDEPLFPVADTPIGSIGCAICYDWLFPEALRQLAANGAEVLVRVSAYMDPWGATEPMDWWTVVNRCRALENIAFVVAANQGASPAPLPALLVAGRQHGRGLRRPHPGPGLARARASASWWRPSTSRPCATSARSRRGHHMLAHLRTEAYPVYRRHVYPPADRGAVALLRGEQRAHRRGQENLPVIRSPVRRHSRMPSIPRPASSRPPSSSWSARSPATPRYARSRPCPTSRAPGWAARP